MTHPQDDTTSPPGLRLAVLPQTFGICRLSPKTRIPRWIHNSSFYSISRSPDELSLICEEALIPNGVQVEGGWSAFRVIGTLDMTLISVLASLSLPLAEARIGLITVSTFDTDYLLVRSKKLSKAIDVLTRAGHRFESQDTPPSESDSHSQDGALEDSPPVVEPAEAEAPTAEQEPISSDEASSEEVEKVVSKRRRSRRGSRRRKTTEAADASAGEAPEAEDSASSSTSETPSSDQRQEADSPAFAPPPPIPGPPPIPTAPGSEAAEPVQAEAQSPDTPSFAAAPFEPRPFAVSDISAQTEELDPAVLQAQAEEEALLAMQATGNATEELDLKTLQALQEAQQQSVEQSLPDPQSLATEEIDMGALVDEGLDLGSLLKKKSQSPSHPAPAAPEDLSAVSEIGPPQLDDPTPRVEDAETSEEAQSEQISAEDLPADEKEPVDDSDPVADGLFTGAIPQEPVETTEDSFESLGISPELIETLEEIGFHHPTPIQAAVIPIALEGIDVIGLAETGSGKTGAFGLPLAERLHHGRGLRGLILCPTREIALQTKAFLDIFGKNHDLETAVIIGGVKFGPQLQAFRRKPDIVVATPGRLADHLRRGNVRLNQLEELVLDEADHMLDLGFLPQIQEILESIPNDRRTLMFSATMPPPIERLAQRFLKDPYTADLRPVNRVAAGIKHRLYLVKDGDQKNCLAHLLKQEEGTTLVFARRKLDTEWLARQLELAGLPVDRIHSDRSQSQRVRALRAFREGKIRILVATDVAARGIDVPQLSHVVNFGLPESLEDYVHRAGRTARGKAVGTVSSIGTWLDKVMIKDIERLIGHEIERCEVEGVDAYRELRPKRKSNMRRRRLL